MRVLYSYPNKIGADRICMTAWEQVAGITAAGADVSAYVGVVHRPLADPVEVHTTLARGSWRIPYRLLGSRAFDLHDRLVARALAQRAEEFDVVHVWPVAARETLRTARRFGIPTVLERPNAHTRFAYETVARECVRLGVNLPRNHEHAHNAARLAREEAEYALADRLLCPSNFVVRTFRDQGFSDRQLARHTYGYDETVFFPEARRDTAGSGLNALFVGVCSVRKGLHFALEAWLNSPASETGTFRIAGAFVPDYLARLERMLAHPSVQMLGHCDNVPELMRTSDVLMLPSIEEGFGLVCVEAMGSGCVPLVSDACTEVCGHGEQGLVHPVADVECLREQLTNLHEDRRLLADLRAGCLEAAPSHTWTKAGARLVEVYEAVAGHAPPAALTLAPVPTGEPFA